MTEVTVQRASGRGIWGWMLFDWAAQPFFTVVTTFIFGPYFVSRMASDPETGQAAWGYGIAAAGLVIAVLSPILGSIADQTGPRKPWIAFFASIKIISLCLLWFAAPGSNLFLVVFFFSLASVAAEFSTVFNDSMMPRLVPKSEIGRISNMAWGLGYLGGMIALIFVVTCLAGSPETGKTIIGIDPLFGLDPKLGEDARATGPLSAGWYFLFILPMFFFTPDAIKGIADRAGGARGAVGTEVDAGRGAPAQRHLPLPRCPHDLSGWRQRAAGAGRHFAAAMFHWSITEIGMFGIILNVVAIVGCLVAARLDTALGSKTIVMISLVLLSIATIGIVSTGPGYTLFGAWMMPGADSGGLFGTAAEKAYIFFGLLIGLAFGPVQASSRSYHGAQRHRRRSPAAISASMRWPGGRPVLPRRSWWRRSPWPAARRGSAWRRSCCSSASA